MSGWDNLTDAQLRAMPMVGLQMRVGIYGIVAADRQTKADCPEVSAALDRAIAALKARGMH